MQSSLLEFQLDNFTTSGCDGCDKYQVCLIEQPFPYKERAAAGVEGVRNVGLEEVEASCAWGRPPQVRLIDTLKILKTKRPYDLLFQDEDEGVEEDGGGTSVCSQRRDDSWSVLIFASFQSSVIKEAVDKNARALIELFTRREPRSDSFATSSPHGAQFGQKLNPPFFKYAEIC